MGSEEIFIPDVKSYCLEGNQRQVRPLGSHLRLETNLLKLITNNLFPLFVTDLSQFSPSVHLTSPSSCRFLSSTVL